MPSYNHGKYLSETIESILNQTFQDLELIIIDDFSKDNSKAIIETYQEKDGRIKAFFHEKNIGITPTTNELIAKSSGKYIARIDSDDVWMKSKLAKQLAILQKNESLIVWSEGEVIDEKSKPTGKTFSQRLAALTRRKAATSLQN